MKEMTWVLPVLTFLPLVGAVVLALIPKESDTAIKFAALATSVAAAVVGVIGGLNFDFDKAGDLQFLVDRAWIPRIGSRFILGLDGLSVPMVALTLLIVPLVIIYSWDHIPQPGNTKAFLSLILILETGMLGSFIAQDLILFFVFFEVVLLPMYFMIGVWGGPDRKYASIKFFLYTLYGSGEVAR